MQRCGGTVEPFFSREISCILCLRDHLSSPEPAECKKHCTHKTCTSGLGLKQVLSAKKCLQGSASIADCAIRFNIPIILTRQLESLLVADTGQIHASASSKPKVYKIRQPFLKVEDVSRKYRPIIYTPRVWPLPSIQVLVITQLRVPYTRYGTVVTYKARVPQARVLYVTTVPYMVYGHEQLCNN